MSLINQNQENNITIDENGNKKRVFMCRRCGNIGFWDLYQIDGFFNRNFYLALRLCNNCSGELKKQIKFFKKV